MNQLNSVIIEGNLVAPAEMKEPVDGFKVCTFSVGVNRWHKKANGEGESEVSYFDVETYNRMAEISSKQGEKGRGVRVVGRLKQNRWTDSNDKVQSRVIVIAEHIEFKPKFNTGKEEEKEVVEVTAKEEVNAAVEKEPVTVGASGEVVNF